MPHFGVIHHPLYITSSNRSNRENTYEVSSSSRLKAQELLCHFFECVSSRYVFRFLPNKRTSPLVGRDRLTAFYDSDTRKSNARTVLTDSCNMCRVYCSCPSSSFIICCSDCSASRISECCWLSCVIVTSRSTLARCCFVVRGALSPRLLMCRNGAQSSQSRIEVRPWLRRTLYEKKNNWKDFKHDYFSAQ